MMYADKARCSYRPPERIKSGTGDRRLGGKPASNIRVSNPILTDMMLEVRLPRKTLKTSRPQLDYSSSLKMG